MKKTIFFLFCSLFLLGSCSKDDDNTENIGFKVSAHLMTSLVETPKVLDELEFKLQLDGLDDGSYILTYDSEDKESQISIGNYKDKTYKANTPITVLFYNGSAIINYKAFNAGVNKISFFVKSADYTANATIEQDFYSDLKFSFNPFDVTEVLTGEGATASFVIMNDTDASNEFFAKYEIVKGIEAIPTLQLMENSMPDWAPSQERKIGAGKTLQTYKIWYSQDYSGEVIIKLTVRDKYGFSASHEYAMRAVTIVDISYEISESSFDIFSWKYAQITGGKPTLDAYVEGNSEIKHTIRLSVDGKPYKATEDIKINVLTEFIIEKVSKVGQVGIKPSRLNHRNTRIVTISKGQSEYSENLYIMAHSKNECINTSKTNFVSLSLHNDMKPIQGKFRITKQWKHTFAYDKAQSIKTVDKFWGN